MLRTDAEGLAGGRWPLLAPWRHTSVLPVFDVLAAVVAVLYRAVRRLLADVERIAADAVARARTLPGRALPRLPGRGGPTPAATALARASGSPSSPARRRPRSAADCSVRGSAGRPATGRLP